MTSWQAHVTAFTLQMARSGWRRVDFADRPQFWRESMNRVALRFARLPETAELAHVIAGDVPARWVELPTSRAHRVVLYLHGGHFICGSAATHQALAARLCEACDARALVLDYRLAPEHAFPAALSDVLSSYVWLLRSGLKADEIVIAGDGAGGGLAVAALMALREQGHPLPAGAVLMSPWLDLALTGRSVHAHGAFDPLLSVQQLSCCAHLYLGGAAPTDPLASPLYGHANDLPPLLIQASKQELLVDDSLRFARSAEAEGVDVTLELLDGPLHGVPFFSSVPEGQAAISRAGSFISDVTKPDTVSAPQAA